MSSIDGFPDIFNLNLVEGEIDHGSPNEVIAETPLQGDAGYVAHTGAAAENISLDSTGQVSSGGGGGGGIARHVTPHPY